MPKMRLPLVNTKASKNFSKKWSLVKCLKKRVAYHHGKMPKFIQNEIVDAFNNRELDVVFCTSTIVEGVNTSAKQVVIFDNKKGQEPLTAFDVKNINGRAGRFLQHFVGRTINLVALPVDSDDKKIKFSYYDDELLADDEILQIKKQDLKAQ